MLRPSPPSIALTPEHYNRLVRMAQNKVPFRISVEVKPDSTTAIRTPTTLWPNSGQQKSDEFVMIGGHLDDVAYGTGATDNAAGCAVMMEVMRILKIWILNWTALFEWCYGAARNRVARIEGLCQRYSAIR